ncbi:MAG: sigma-54-dependent Fis family transcriptional regulator [Candidatus Schekmanbacteria bacterium]|nr:sigma-54-dependent Fis family transcriptional regulator [Candidatus Schekmanbacteria bacterium]
MPDNKISVLIVSEDQNTREELASCFNDVLFSVEKLAGSIRARDLISKKEFDIIFSDIHMTYVDGMELLEAVKSKSPVSDVILMSNRGTITLAIDALKKGAHDFLQLPIDTKHFRNYLINLGQRRMLINENRKLKEMLKIDSQNDEIVGTSPRIKLVYKLIDEIAPTDVTVLLEGESGTGKELVARAIHRRSHRNDRPFIALNCGALPETLIESELFGYEKGAFTGAVARKKGRIEQAHTGTLFLDEIAELTLNNQVDLLRVLEEQKVMRLGGLERTDVDVRFIAATNKDLEQLCSRGEFREDLFYRLNVIRLKLPPLRDRQEDIPLLANAFVEKFCRKYSKDMKSLSHETSAILNRYSFPGNVRELKNIVERAVVLSKETTITPHDLPEQIYKDIKGPVQREDGDDKFASLKVRERNAIKEALELSGGHRQKTAKLLGMSLRTLHYKLKRYNIGSK